MNPSFSTRWMTNEVLSNRKVAKLDLHGEGCPQGMVPIQRTKVEDQTYFKSSSKSHGGSFHTLAANYPGEHVSYVVLIMHTLELFMIGSRLTAEEFYIIIFRDYNYFYGKEEKN